MKGDPVNDTFDAVAAENGGTFDAQQAAQILGQASQQARRQFEQFPPWFSAARGVAALAAYGAVWLDVRGQHPYAHPTAALIPVGIAFGVVCATMAVVLARRATSGVSGKTPLRPAEIAIVALAWIGVFVVLGLLAGYGVSHSIVYGVYPAAVPLIAVGLPWAGIMAKRGNWLAVVEALALVVVGAVAVATGPIWAWLVVGLGICVVLLVRSAIVARNQRA
jgi:hypothetical protein